MKWVAVFLSFAFAGAGYVLAVPHRRIQGVLWTLAAIGFTYVEQIAVGPEHPAFWPMFVSVFILNTAFAWDTYQEITALEQGTATA